MERSVAPAADARRAARGPTRWLWFGAGWLAVGLGGIGIVVPGLPTTVFFIVAASCFARSSPRFERWVLELPRIGPLVADHRAGLGMPRRVKAWAIGMMLVFGGAGVSFALDNVAVAAVVMLAVLTGAWYVAYRVPTRSEAAPDPAATGAAGTPDGTPSGPTV